MHPSILRNTLISRAGVGRILSLPSEEKIYASLSEILSKFQGLKKFASEIHTEIHLIKPILKIFGYAYESKPKFFMDGIKGPDVALFAAEGNRVEASPLWGTAEYYDNTLGILLLKRYGRALDKGISGFYLEFENKIPVHQTIYLLKNTKTQWGILTNGRTWMLIKKPLGFEKRLIEIDIETPSASGEDQALHLFYHIFSLQGLTRTLPEILEHERNNLITLLRGKRDSARESVRGLKTKSDLHPEIINIFKEFLPEARLPLEHFKPQNVEHATGGPAGVWDALRALPKKGAPRTTLPNLIGSPGEPDAGLQVGEAWHKFADKTIAGEKTGGCAGEAIAPRVRDIFNGYDAPDIFSYLFSRKPLQAGPNFEDIFFCADNIRTKEDVLSLRILDMAPGFGSTATRILEGLAYLSFSLPYRDRATFVAEWEEEQALRKYILDHVLYGVERSPTAYAIFQGGIKSRFQTSASHYKAGNPLVGLSIRDLARFYDVKNQMALFGRAPSEIIDHFRETYRRYFALSDRIKEDAELKCEIEVKLRTYGQRIRDVLDMITATYFTRSVDGRRVQEALFELDGSPSVWEILRGKTWYVESKEIAAKNGFFHFEIEFPFLLNSGFDFIFCEPALTYIWEEGDSPFLDVTKACIKKGMAYLKPDGKFVISAENAAETLTAGLQESKKYNITLSENAVILTKKDA